MKKLIVIVLSMLMMAATLASCSSTADTTSKTSEKNSTASSNVVSAAKATLKVGVDDCYPPMEYKDDKMTTIGFDIDLAKEIAKRMNMDIEFVSTAWDGIFQALKTDKFDCIISSVSMTTSRVTEYEFTKAYIANSQMIVVKPDNNTILAATDLTGKNVGYQVATTANESADKLKAQGIKFKSVKAYDQIIQPFSDMTAGRLDAIIVDEVVGQYYIGQDSTKFKAASVKLTNEPIGVCLKKGNVVLQAKIQVAIDSMIADGTMKQISMTWFKKDLTSNIDTVLKEMN